MPKTSLYTNNENLSSSGRIEVARYERKNTNLCAFFMPDFDSRPQNLVLRSLPWTSMGL